MSTTFKKGWYLGKPLRELLPNTKYFKYWYLGKPFSVFDKPSTPSVPITVQVDCVHLTLHQNAQAGWITVFPVSLSLVLSSYDPSPRAGVVESARISGAGVEVLYSPIPTGYVSQVVPQVEYSETFIEVDQAGVVTVYEETPAIQVNQAGVVTVYEETPAIQVNQAGVVVIYTVDGVFLVGIQSLALVLYEPTITAIQMLELDLQHLILELHAPYVYISYSVITLPVTKHLTFSQFSPSVHQGCSITVSIVSLNLNSYTPLVLIGAQVSETLEAVLSIHSPTVNYSSRFFVSKLSLVFSLKAPTICHNGVGLAFCQSLLLSVYTPAMRNGVNLDETLSLTLHQALSPTIAWGYVVTISAAKHLVLSQKSVSVVAIKNALCFPIMQSLILVLLEPEALMGVSIKETLNLSLDKYAPEIHASSINVVSFLHLTFQMYAPTIRIHARNLVDIQSLVLSSYDVSVIVGYVIKITLVLQLTHYDVDIFYGSTLTPEPLHLILTEYDPSVLAEPTGEPYDYDIDPLHKEREWGSSLTLGHGEYASRSGSALSSRFPLQSTDIDKQITVCCWLRMKGLSGRQTVFAKLLNSTDISLGLCLLGNHFYLKWGETDIDLNDIVLVTDRWYHVGLAIDGVNRSICLHVWDDKAKIVMNQTASADPFARPYPDSVLPVGNGNFHIGYYHDQYSADMWLNGYVDEFVVFNKLKSPFDMDQIRMGRFNGSSAGETVSDFSLMTGYDPEGRITVSDYATQVGYDLEGRITVSDYALMVAYHVPIPLPPSRFPVISGFPSPGSGTAAYVFCNINYKFKSDVSSFDYGTNMEARESLYSLPSRELETMIGLSDESSYLRLLETLSAGATIYSVPMWAFRTVLTSNAHAADLEFVAEDVSNLYVGEKVLLVRANDASIYDLCDITGIAGQTISVATPLTLHHHKIQMPTEDLRYDERSCYVVPCITGFVDAEDVELKGNKPTFWLKVKVNGGAWINAGHPEMITFTQAPAEAGLISPKVERTLVGTENGIIEMMPHLLTSRLAFQVEWYFKDTNWRILRDMFISARGKTASIPMPTWCFELRVLSHHNSGSSTIELTSGFEHIWSRFKRLLVYPIHGAAPFTIMLDAYLGSNMYTCTSLASELYPGDKVSLYPDVRFMEDELVFEFLYYNECKVKTSFIEVVS
jgi:hypothetical protein